MIFTFLLPLIPCILVTSKKLSTEENERNLEICGVYKLEEKCEHSSRVGRSVGGREMQSNEYPWTFKIESMGGLECSGVQISPRHILTAAHCLMDIRNDQNCKSDPDSVVWKMLPSDSFQVLARKVLARRRKESNSECQDDGRYEVKKIHTLDFHRCGFRNDIALIEIRSNISDCISTPICMPDDNHIIDQVLYSTGYGSQHSHNNGIDESDQPQIVAQMFVGVDRTEYKIGTNAYGKSTCQGDSGGPVFQTNNNKNILIGITSSGDECTRTNNHNIRSLAVDVRQYLHWICALSGVCPRDEETMEGEE